MILEKRETDVLTKGQFITKDVSISLQKNLDKVIYMLSNGLYSKPEESSIREILSNGQDSHVEAGIDSLEKPVLVTLDDNLFSVTDYGVGIDDERMSIIEELGGSTKDEREDMIGTFGIGFFAPLSYTSQFICESIKNKVKRTWLVQKVSGKTQISKVGEEICDEPNKTFIAISLKGDYSTWQDALLKTIPYFKGVYVDCKDLPNINNTKIYEGKYFIINEKTPVASFHIVLDQVVYPLPYRDFGFPCDIPVGFKFGLNEGITPLPNRESVIIDDLTKIKIQQRVKEGIVEMLEYIDPVTNAYQYINKNKDEQKFKFKEHYFTLVRSYHRYILHFDLADKLKEKEVSIDSTHWTSEYLTSLSNCVKMYATVSYGGKINYQPKSWITPSSSSLLIDIPWNNKVSSFVREHSYDTITIVRPNSLWKYFYKALYLKKQPREKWRAIVTSFLNDLTLIENSWDKLSNYTDEINKKREKVKQVQVARKSKEIISISTPTADGKSGKYKLVMNSTDFSSDKLPVKGLYIYSNDREELDILHHLWQNNSKIYPCFMTEKNIEKIKEIKPKNFIPLSEFTKGSHRLTKKWVTVALIQEELADYRWAYNKKDYYHKQDAPKLDFTWLKNGILNQSFKHILEEAAEYSTVYNSYTKRALKGLIETFKTAGLLDYALYREWCYVKTELDKLKLLKEINTGNGVEINMFNHFITYKKGRDFYKQQYLNLKGCK